MRDELFRILEKDDWDMEDVEELSMIFEDESILEISPDILETALKVLFKGRGSFNKRLKTASLMTGISPEKLERFVKLERKRSDKKEVEFEDLLKKAKILDHRCLKGIEDVELAAEISESFKKAFLDEISIHPYIKSVVLSRKRKPLIVDGSNLLWRNDLDVSVLDDLFISLADFDPVFFPVKIVFDRNIRYVVPKSERKKLEDWLSLECVHLHSPADDLIISLARDMRAVIASSDRFLEYDTRGLEIIDFSKFNL